MLVFDNRGDLPNGGTSRVIEFDPATLAIEWQYPGPDDPAIYTAFLGSQQRLPNGNTLICESSNGRIIEVDPDGNIVWDYRVPEIIEKADGSKRATAIFATRFLPEQLPFLDDTNPAQAAE